VGTVLLGGVPFTLPCSLLTAARKARILSPVRSANSEELGAYLGASGKIRNARSSYEAGCGD
jgi:hypothetical protein